MTGTLLTPQAVLFDAGKAAGMRTVAVLSGFDPAPALAAEKPDALIDSVGDLKRVVPLLRSTNRVEAGEACCGHSGNATAGKTSNGGS